MHQNKIFVFLVLLLFVTSCKKENIVENVETRESEIQIPKNDFFYVNEDTYFIDENGDFVISNWAYKDGEWYYFGIDGKMLKNLWIDNTYFVGSDGKMLKDTVTFEGYEIDKDGKIKDEYKKYLEQEPLQVRIKKAKVVSKYGNATTIDKMDTVTFGRYKLGDNDDYSDIEWLVLEKKNGKALLLSKYILDVGSHIDEELNISWNESKISKFLNEVFLNSAFSFANQLNILSNDDGDRIFLLSKDECKKYFGKAIISKEKEEKGLEVNKRLRSVMAKRVENDIETEYKNIFWLRTKGFDELSFMIVDKYGFIDEHGYASYMNLGIRPAIYVTYF